MKLGLKMQHRQQIIFSVIVTLVGSFVSLRTVQSCEEQISFSLPSQNIYCALVGESLNILRCEIGSFLNPLPPQSKTSLCEFDWGAGFSLTQGGAPEILCISDTIGKSEYVLEYGQSWSKNGFKCQSEITGLTCTNQVNQGFFLSRDSWQTF